MIKFTLYLFLTFLAISSAVTRAMADEQPKPVKARMLADVSAVIPDVPFDVAVLLELEPHWHVYWKNPGDSGLPTSVKFSLPEGFTVSGLNWPVPGILKGAGGLTDYGYEDSLLLSARVTPPADIKPGSVAKITAMVSWVSCQDICIPGRTELTLDLPVSKTSAPANTGLFSEWRGRLPVNLTGGAPPFKTDLKTEAEDDNGYSVVISLDWKEDLKDIALYPVPGNSYVVGDIVVDTDEENGKSSISFDVKEVQSHESSQESLDTLIVYTGRDGKKSGYEFEVPLHK
jgi:DsbC/DsbD-like thiol-disulfide interchange protein